ncbi:MAG: UDP-N-acetylmuramoyl-L-alanyl-D-glutamate--2,6-diaminopimelate ligase, partial [Clostridia bacterium]|nr:UDP-N-acetylmuramoyl-L-alanyl-D-glutamate--2,6-diaminopimelate ligase [Clostridia bacterium]
HESPDGIAKEVLLGVEIKEKATVILDRYNAISYAINNAQFGDTVIVAGKGEEDYMEIDGKFYPFKDEDTIIKVLTEK